MTFSMSMRRALGKKVVDQTDSDLRKDLTCVAWIRCCGQRKDFVRELLHCVRDIRADENAEASGSGAILRLDKRRLSLVVYAANSIGDEKKICFRVFPEMIFGPFEGRSEIRSHVEGRRC